MSAAREAQRQQQLLRTLWRADSAQALQPWVRDEGAVFTRGLQAYQAHAGALAQRALAAAYPTVQQLLGDASFGALARTLWQRHPPERGDVDTWGTHLAAFMQQDADLADEPYLPDVARLEWAVHRASRAADDDAPPAGLHHLADTDPAGLWLLPRVGTVLVVSPYPVVMLWQAHQPDRPRQPDRFADVRQALAQGLGQAALVWRQGGHVQVDALDPAESALCQAVLRRHSLGQALEATATGDAADRAMAFEPWLLRQLRRGWLAGAALAAQDAA
jgi:Putative DNA-binding domain